MLRANHLIMNPDTEDPACSWITRQKLYEPNDHQASNHEAFTVIFGETGKM